MDWKVAGLGCRWTPRRALKFNYYLEMRDTNKYLGVEYRARNMLNNAIVPLSGNKGRDITNFVSFDTNPENRMSTSAYPMMGRPFVLSTEVPGWFYTVLNKKG